MSHHKRKTRHKRDAYIPASGSVVVSNPTPTASALAQNTVVPPSLNPTGVPLVTSALLGGASTAAAQSSTPTTSTTASTSASSGNQISLGTVIGACVAALVAFLLAIALAIYCSKRQKQTSGYLKSRNAVNNGSRRRSHLEAWTRIDDDGDQKGQEQRDRPMRQRPPSGPLGAMFQRTISNTSGDKSWEGHNRESVGTMQHFAKYHPCLAAEMASHGHTKCTDGEIAKPPPVLHLMGRGLDMTPPVSWDGETIGGDSLMSLHSGLSNPKLPHMMATAKSTPPATVSSLHRWESAEVMHVGQVDSDFSEVRPLRNPFADGTGSIKSSPKGQNPFFSARDHPVKRTLPPDTYKNPFIDSDSTRDSSSAIRSLIAALEVPHQLDNNDRIVSVQSSVYSRGTGDDGDSAISVTAFPYPPTQVKLR